MPAGAQREAKVTHVDVSLRQQFDGHWDCSDALARDLGFRTKSELLLLLETDSGMTSVQAALPNAAAYWATSLTITIFRLRFSANVPECALILAKAEGWLRKALGAPTMEVLLDAAKVFVSSHSSI